MLLGCFRSLSGFTTQTRLHLLSTTLVEQAIAAGVKNIWMQPGAEHAEASNLARKAGLNVIDDGSCILVLLAREPRR